MGILTIRNVDDDVIVALKARAKANHRSLEGELRYLLGRHAIPAPTLGLVRERARLAASATADLADPCADDRPHEADWMGAMSDVGEIVGDIVSPATDPSDWDALSPETVQPKATDGK